MLARCLESLARGASRCATDVLVVDNGSADGSAGMVREHFPAVRLVANASNVGFARAVNQLWPYARGRYWLLLNPDTETKPGAIDTLVALMDSQPQAGLATAKLLNADGSPQFCAQARPSPGRVLLEASRLHKLLPLGVRGHLLLSSYWTYEETRPVGWTWGTALIARRAAVEAVGLLDERLFMYGEDLDWCLRMQKAGWTVWFCAEAEVVHHGRGSARLRWDRRSLEHRLWATYYQVVAWHEGSFFTRRLQLATLLALMLDWASALLRGTTRPILGESIHTHWRLLLRDLGAGVDSA